MKITSQVDLGRLGLETWERLSVQAEFVDFVDLISV
jgi:hypothetical protein